MPYARHNHAAAYNPVTEVSAAVVLPPAPLAAFPPHSFTASTHHPRTHLAGAVHVWGQRLQRLPELLRHHHALLGGGERHVAVQHEQLRQQLHGKRSHSQSIAIPINPNRYLTSQSQSICNSTATSAKPYVPNPTPTLTLSTPSSWL